MVLLLERSKLVVEGAGAVAVAALMQGKVKPAREGTAVAVLSGGNVDASLLAECIRLGETSAGRRIVIFTMVPDRPGALAGLLRVVAEHGANVVDVSTCARAWTCTCARPRCSSCSRRVAPSTTPRSWTPYGPRASSRGSSTRAASRRAPPRAGAVAASRPPARRGRRRGPAGWRSRAPAGRSRTRPRASGRRREGRRRCRRW